jgi:dTDP-4-amino-4,6-dideoxygalactose transaminase
LLRTRCSHLIKRRMVQFSNPKAQYLSYKAEIDKAIAETLESGWYILGEQTKLFEQEFAEYIGAKYAIGVGSGTEALHVALTACGVGPGDEVITVAHTAVATVSAIELCGASPIFADIEEDFYTIDPSNIEKLISPKTKAIIAVHLYGLPANLKEIIPLAKKYNLIVIEDCAQCHGSTYEGKKLGSIGDIACFSFYPTKNLGAIGDGGAIVTNDLNLAEKVLLIREYGWAQRYISHIPGWNSRLDELQAAVLRVKLRTLDEDNDRRLKIAAIYDRGLRGTELILPAKRQAGTHVYHLYVVRSQKRDKLKEFLQEKSIGTGIHYPVPIHRQKAYIGRLKGNNSLEVTERVSKEILSLPMYPELPSADLQSTIQAIKEFENVMA